MKKLRAGVILMLFSAVPVFAESTDEFISYEDLKPGQKGYGLTVLQGEAPEKFKVEFVGTIPNPAYPKTRIILAKLGDPLKNCNVISGMSGSPIYFEHNGKWKLAGALALGWDLPSNKEALVGITPIQLMLNQEEVLGLRKTAEPEPKDSSAPLSVLPDSRELKPGDSIALIFIKGDSEEIGVGTVTYVKGNRFWAFGHGLFGAGEIIIPAAKAKIAVSLKSSAVGFKMTAEVGKIVGRIEYDNIFAIEGRIGKLPEDPMLPVNLSLKIRNGSEVEKAEFEFQVLKNKLFTGDLISYAARGLLEKISPPGGKRATAFSSVVISFDDHLPIIINDSLIIGETAGFGIFTTNVGPAAAASKGISAVKEILNSDLGPKITDLRLKIDLDLSPKIFYLDSCLILDKNNAVAETARLGEEVNLLIGLRSFDNRDQFVIKTPVKIPERLNFQNPGEKTVEIYIESGNSYEERDEKKILGRNPQTREEFMAGLLKDLKDPQKIYIQILFPPTLRRPSSLPEIAKYPKQEWRRVESLDALKNFGSAETKALLQELPLPKENFILTLSHALFLKLLPAEKNKPKKDGQKKGSK